MFDRIVQSGKLDEPVARAYFKQLVGGVAYCHSQGVAHRDLKPENLLLDEKQVLKISDFGLSALYDGEEGASRSQMLDAGQGPRASMALQRERFVITRVDDSISRDLENLRSDDRSPRPKTRALKLRGALSDA